MNVIYQNRNKSHIYKDPVKREHNSTPVLLVTTGNYIVTTVHPNHMYVHI